MSKTTIKLTHKTRTETKNVTDGFVPFDKMGMNRKVDLSFTDADNSNFIGVLVQNQINSLGVLKSGEKLIIEIGETS